MSDAEPPHDLEAERAVLGAMLLATDKIEPHPIATAVTTLAAGDFYRETHSELFRVICELWEHGEPTDPINVSSTLADRKLLMRLGGAPYLHTLIAAVPVVANAGYYADIVADKAQRRRLLEAGQRVAQLAVHGGKDDTADILERARQTVDDATTAVTADDAEDGAWLGDLVDPQIDSWTEDEPQGVPAPFADLNEVLSGVRPGQLVLIAARPGIGKSAIATDWARYAAKGALPTLLVSLEMGRREITERIIAAESKVRLADIRARSLSPQDRYRVERKRAAIAKLPVRIEDRFALTLARLRATAQEMARSDGGLKLLILDYIQLLTPSDPKVARREQVDAFSRGLKSLAKELHVPVIALAQLNRGPEARTDKKPMMSDLRESGALEQDADIVILISRPDAFERDDPRAGEADLILAKNRNGPTATITVAHQLHYARFADIARGDEPDGD